MPYVVKCPEWEKMLAGVGDPIQLDNPLPGFYKRRFVRNGPWVPARIWIEEDRDEDGNLMSDQTYHCMVDGLTRDAFDQWSWIAKNPITEDEYWRMFERAEWCRENAPDEPVANPKTPINLRTSKPVLPPKG